MDYIGGYMTAVFQLALQDPGENSISHGHLDRGAETETPKASRGGKWGGGIPLPVISPLPVPL